MNKYFIFSGFIIFLLVLTGCWDRVELNDIAIVSASSVDKSEDNLFRVGVMIPLPSAMGGAGSEGGGGGTSSGGVYFVDSETGRTLHHAINKMQDRMSRYITFGHRRVVVFGQDLAREGIGKAIDPLSRDRESRLNTQMLIAREKGLDTLNASPFLEQLTSEALREISTRQFWITVRDYLYELELEGNDPFIPIVDVVENKSNNPEMTSKHVEIMSVGILKDDKLIYVTDEKQTEGIRWMMGKAGETEVLIPVKEDQEIVVEVLNQTSTIEHEFSGELPKFNVNVEANFSISENTTNLNLEEVSAFREIEEKINEEVSSYITALLDENLKQGIDTFGFGWRLNRKDPKQWDRLKDNWRETLPNIEVDVIVDSRLESSGLTGKTVGSGSDS